MDSSVAHIFWFSHPDYEWDEWWRLPQEDKRRIWMESKADNDKQRCETCVYSTEAEPGRVILVGNAFEKCIRCRRYPASQYHLLNDWCGEWSDGAVSLPGVLVDYESEPGYTTYSNTEGQTWCVPDGTKADTPTETRKRKRGRPRKSGG